MATLLAEEPSIEVAGFAEDGPSAVARALELLPDVVLMDVRMPNGGGVAAAAAISARLPNTRIILLSGLWAEDSLREPPEGVYAVLTKNMNLRQLVAVVQAAAGATPRDARLRRSEVSGVTGDRLSSREIQILGMLAKGYRSDRIATELELKQKTVRNYISVIYDKLGVRGRSRAVLYAARSGLLDELA
jgi:DNA-binding NarL/FixJ family response regulator